MLCKDISCKCFTSCHKWFYFLPEEMQRRKYSIVPFLLVWYINILMNFMTLEYTRKNCNYYWSLKFSEHTHIFDFFFTFSRRFIMEEIKRGTTFTPEWLQRQLVPFFLCWRCEVNFSPGSVFVAFWGIFCYAFTRSFWPPFCSQWRVLESDQCPFNMELSTHPLPFPFLSFLND